MFFLPQLEQVSALLIGNKYKDVIDYYNHFLKQTEKLTSLQSKYFIINNSLARLLQLREQEKNY